MKRLAALLLVLGLALPASAFASSPDKTFDWCPNIDGIQSKVPGNMTVVIETSGASWYCVLKTK